MQFTVLPVGGRPVSPVPGQAFLVRDNWDDYSFKTTFQLLCVGPGGDVREIGAVKIGRFGMTAPARTQLPDSFESLDGAFFSLGLQDTYYERLHALGPDLQRAVLRALNDVSFDRELFSRARAESVMGTSLLRSVSADAVMGRFRDSGIPGGPSAAITDVTRRHLFDALRSTGVSWSGSLDEVTFLRRLYDLDRLKSHDPRFATAEDDIVQHRYNNPEDWEDDWVFGDDRFQLADGADEVLLRFLREMIHPAVRTDADEVQQLLELVNDHLAPDGYKLAQARAVSGYPVYEARRIPPRRPTARPAPPAAVTSAPPGQGAYAAVRRAARGERKDYACPREPEPDGGQADVFEAIHKATGTTVALKKLHSKYPAERQVARMRREIEIGQLLDGHPHAMPILDFGADHTWFVMPWAQATAVKRRELLREPAELRALVDALASVLAAAHGHGWLHRDIKPSNILHFDDCWTLADWGIVRRPRGQTTKVGRTGLHIGTEGFAAPELSVAPHEATESSDIYSIGRVIAWALTGKMPETNLPLLPPPGPWRPVVRAATHQDPQRRPQSVHDLLALIDREHADVPEDPFPRAQILLETTGTGDTAAADTLLALVGDHPEDYELHVGVLTRLDTQQAGAALGREAAQAHRLLHALAEHVGGDDTHIVQFGEAATVVVWLQGICAYAAGHRDWDLLEEAAHTMCTWDGTWDQWNAQDKVTPWLRTLTDEAAAVIAAVLRDHPESAQHFSHIADDRTADPRIRQAVRTSTAP
ncbi:serine/threonine protein kinase [Streptomyces scabiei]|uniref:AbiJ-related protein n=1 Tax=Streptomyces scabiei TaxID=1930 RepID=UPI001B315581|nr:MULTISPECIES: serine/threonine protein kinase [Streptomyces]MBP5880861.1 serine/threonine protein kinase [Streptomyces sp. LBUM 1487]MBP5896614.1 serine/threonine protein kinase [Streptomyces sp. LBUM 1488]MDW8478539.1 serine/threonine protein kinase [Streptomyces scabiei]MDX2570263.1 serine/threonine protein kinase [Streptomyces scabiei]MDX3158177.1 serine/threonine protein kinase [Streptomyces scabiei]